MIYLLSRLTQIRDVLHFYRKGSSRRIVVKTNNCKREHCTALLKHLRKL